MVRFAQKLVSLSCIFTMNCFLPNFNINLPLIKETSITTNSEQYNKQEKEKKESLKENFKDLKEQYQKLKNNYECVKEQFSLMEKNNKELLQDNICLQNTIKITANGGRKPLNYLTPPRIVSRGYYRTNYLGDFKITAYTPCKEECGNNLGITSSGSPIIAGYSVAVDNKIWPMGTVFYIKGIGYVVAMDTGGMISGRKRMDLAIFDKSEANQFGVRYMEVYLVKYGNGKVNISQIFKKN